MDVQSRLKQFMQYKHMTHKGFESRVGLANASASRINENSRASTFDRIANAFPDINIDWLKTGEGEMLVGNAEVTAYSNDSDKSFFRKEDRLIPFYDAETTGGYNGGVSSSMECAPLMGYVDAGGWFQGRETAAIRHVGDSMVEFPNGCLLAVREVVERRLLVPGRIYVIETDEFRVTKRVQKGSEKGSIALYSSNQDKYPDGRLIYEPFELNLSDIRRIFSILGYIVNQSGEAPFIMYKHY